MTMLDDIIGVKREEVAAMPDYAGVPPSERKFVAGLRSHSPCLIAEVKPRSPSSGMLLEPAQTPYLVADYNQRAQAISVLCDHAFFGGGFDLLRRVRAMSDMPLLAKEFILDAKQVCAARHHGADAVLLIAGILDTKTIAALALEAAALGMGVLLELHDEDDLAKIPAMDAGTLAIGINNRNLATLKIDLETTLRLAPLIRKRFPGHVLIAESGVATPDDLARLRPAVDGFLIGTGLLTGTMSGAFPPLAR